jgi:hypothetical protein
VYAGLPAGRDPNTYIGASTDINANGSAHDLRNGVFTSGAGGGVVYNDSFHRIFCVRSDCGGDLNADNSKDGTFFAVGAWPKGAGNSIAVSARGAIFYENDRTNPTVPTHSTSTDLSGWKLGHRHHGRRPPRRGDGHQDRRRGLRQSQRRAGHRRLQLGLRRP